MEMKRGDNPAMVHCRVCGVWCLPPYRGYAKDAVCSRPCYDEFKWRETLQIVKKPYYPHGEAE